MKTVTISDVHNRLRNTNSGEPNPKKVDSYRENARKAIESGYASRIIYYIENGIADRSMSMAEDTMFDLFDALCETGTVSQIAKYGNIILKEYVARTRDAKETNTYLKRKLGNAKSSLTTKINNRIDEIINGATNAVKAAGNNFKTNIAGVKDRVSSVVPAALKPKDQNTDEEAKAEAAIVCYEAMVLYTEKLIAIDRILENYNRVSKRFNIDRIIQENTNVNGIYDTTIEICKLIDTYDMTMKARYNTCLETVWYGLHKNSIPFDESEIVTTISDYYMAQGNNSFACKQILEASVVFDVPQYQDDWFNKNRDVILDDDDPADEEFPMDEAKLTSKQKAKLKDSDYGLPSKKKYPMPDESHVRSAIQMFNHCDPADEAELAKNIKKKMRIYGLTVDVGKENRFSKYYSPKDESAAIIGAGIREYATNNSGYVVPFEEATNFNKVFNDFKASNEENKESKLKGLIRKLYARNVEGVVDGTPNLLKYIRGIVIIGGMAIHPIVSLVLFIADQIISLSLNRDETEKMLNCFKKEIRATDKKIETTKDAETKKKLEEYRKDLTGGYEKINEYYETLITDEELDARYDNPDDLDIRGGGSFSDKELDDFEKSLGLDGDDDFDFDDMDDLDGLDEAVKYIKIMDIITESYSNLMIPSFDKKQMHKIITNYPAMSGTFAEISEEFPTLIPDSELIGAIDDIRSDAQVGAIKLGILDKYELTEAYNRLTNKKTSNDNSIIDIFSEARHFAIQREVAAAMNEIYNSCVYNTPLTEASFKNTIAIAQEKLKKAFTKLSDKEKSISRSIDVSANNFKKGVEKTLTSDNREAVIKGTILPSASKVIKAAIINAGVAVFIHPAIAVIGTLGWILASKRYKAKERQMVIDEIEIELKMCEKYIQLAEEKNDLKALKQLYQIQRDLERQRGRVKYHMATKGEKFYDTKDLPQAGVE